MPMHAENHDIAMRVCESRTKNEELAAWQWRHNAN